MQDTITAERLVLEPLRGAHVDQLFEPLSDERLYRWIPLLPPPSKEALRRRWDDLARRLCPPDAPAALNWAARRASDGRYVGELDPQLGAGRVATNLG